MDEERRAPLTPEQLAAWRQLIVEEDGRTGRLIADAVIAEVVAVAEQGHRAARPVPAIAREIGLSARTIRYRLKAWQQKGLLRKDPVGGSPGEGRQQGNALEPTLPKEIKEPEMEQEDYGCIWPARAGPQRKSRSLERLRLTAV